MLSNPDRPREAVQPPGAVANFVNTLPVVRWAMEKAVGISAKKELPPSWARRSRRGSGGVRRRRFGGEPSAKVVFYPTCSVEWNRPEIGRAAIQVLERNRVEVVVEYPRCCGMPFFDVGDTAAARGARADVVAALKPWVEKGYTSSRRVRRAR